MESSNNVKCAVCGKIFVGGAFDYCPRCDWMFGWGQDKESDDFPSPLNHGMTKQEAKEKFSKGLNMWGKPLKDTPQSN